MTRRKLIFYYWLPIPLLIGLGAVFNREVDINVHDTYFVLDYFYLFLLVSLFLFISGLGYFLDSAERANQRLSKIQFWLYLIGGVGFLLLEFTQHLISKNGLSEEFVEYQNIESSIQIYMGQLVSLTLILIGFLIYLLNMVGVILKRIKSFPLS